jgi:hypothetical protein
MPRNTEGPGAAIPEPSQNVVTDFADTAGTALTSPMTRRYR